MLHTEEIEYPFSKILSKNFIAYNKQNITTPTPAVIIIPDWRGRSELYCQKAREIAELGYIGITIDLYGGAIIGQAEEDKKVLHEPLKKDRQELINRMLDVYNFVSNLPYVDNTKVAAMGYCFGGMAVLDLARAGSGIKGVISLHGLLNPPNLDLNNKITSKILVLHAYEDVYVKPTQVLEFAEEMNPKGVDWQVHIYGGVEHSFTNPDANDPALGLKYDKVANQRSFESSKLFLEDLFKS